MNAETTQTHWICSLVQLYFNSHCYITLIIIIIILNKVEYKKSNNLCHCRPTAGTFTTVSTNHRLYAYWHINDCQWQPLLTDCQLQPLLTAVLLTTHTMRMYVILTHALHTMHRNTVSQLWYPAFPWRSKLQSSFSTAHSNVKVDL